MQTTLKKILSFAQFQEGWSFGEGVAFAKSTVDKAVQLAKTAHTLGFHETDAFPGLNGEIMITVYQGNEYWEFTLEPTETITFVYEKADEIEFQICEGSESHPLTHADFVKGE